MPINPTPLQRDTRATLIAVVAALALAALAYATRPRPVQDAVFADIGEVFFPAFTEPAGARAIEIVAFDEEAARNRAFSVEMRGGAWIIPSHYDYPADAQEQLARAAAAFVGLVKEEIVTDQASDHERLGVLPPDDDAGPLAGRGVRVVIKDESGRTLSDLIFGDELQADPNAPASETLGKRRYARVPGKNRVYVTTLDTDFSTRFADWIETDLLQLERSEVTSITLDQYSVEETTGQPVNGDLIELVKSESDGGDAVWSVAANDNARPADVMKIGELLDALDELKIVDVATKPENLRSVLAGGANAGLLATDALNLQARGFFLTERGLVANEGAVIVRLGDGLEYTLMFGEVAQSQGDAITELAGAKGDAAADAPGSAQGGATELARYLFVTVRHVEEAAPEATTEAAPETQPEAGEANPPAPEAETPSEPAPGVARAKALSERFARWYYLIDDELFTTLRPGLEELVDTEAASDTAAPDTEPAIPPTPFTPLEFPADPPPPTVPPIDPPAGGGA